MTTVLYVILMNEHKNQNIPANHFCYMKPLECWHWDQCSRTTRIQVAPRDDLLDLYSSSFCYHSETFYYTSQTETRMTDERERGIEMSY